MTAPTMKQRLALRLFQSVTEDTEATWEGLTDEERQDALKWAEEALDELREPDEEMVKAAESKSVFFTSDSDDYAFDVPPKPRITWGAMINVARNEDER